MQTTFDSPRYLVSFHPKRIAHRFTDVLVLGSGLAGLRAALAIDSSRNVLIMTKDSAKQSNSQYAQGGIAAVWNPEDCFEAHAEDTIQAGKGLCEERIVDLVISEAPRRVQELIRWGTVFDQENGQLALTREGGHRFSRILHALGDATGKEVIRTVLGRVRDLPNVQIIENTFTIDLLTYSGRCVGALTWSSTAGVQAVWAQRTILATGGCGQLYRETTNPAIATGDGLAIAFRAGADLQDLEFMQFHPTVLYVAGSSRSLISEAVRGEGAYLRDSQGHRFMTEYDPRAELAPRDIVARAIVKRMALTNHSCVYLDQSHLDPDTVRARFPGITAVCDEFGLDFGRDLVPVRPGAHFMVGGVQTDEQGKTTLPGLWATGEVASTGLHGANRLASNSLLETLVFGHRSGEGASNEVVQSEESFRVPAIEHDFEQPKRQELDLTDIRNSLRSLLFRKVGIERDRTGLADALASVDFWSKYVLRQEFSGPAGWELQNMLTVAGLMIRTALERTESRGTHNRSDFPETDEENWHCHLLVRPKPFELRRVKVSSTNG